MCICSVVVDRSERACGLFYVIYASSIIIFVDFVIGLACIYCTKLQSQLLILLIRMKSLKVSVIEFLVQALSRLPNR